MLSDFLDRIDKMPESQCVAWLVVALVVAVAWRLAEKAEHGAEERRR